MIYLLIALLIIGFLLWKFYFIKYDTIIAYTGGLGSGKSFLSVKMAIKLLKKNRRKVKFHNLLQLLKKKENRVMWLKPYLYSSIPIKISKNEYSFKLTEEHLLLRERLIPRSIVFIDEIGSYATQFEYKNQNINDCFDEFVRLFRHYTTGGYLVCNDQCSENIVLQVRRRINQVFNLMHFKKWFWIFYTCKCRNMNISEEIKTIEEQNTEDNMRTLIGLMPFVKHYDTYCYSERYRTVTTLNDTYYTKLKKCELLKVSTVKKYKMTTDEEL